MEVSGRTGLDGEPHGAGRHQALHDAGLHLDSHTAQPAPQHKSIATRAALLASAAKLHMQCWSVESKTCLRAGM